MHGWFTKPLFWCRSKKSQITESGRWEKHINPYIGNVEIERMTTLDYIKLKIELEKKI